MAKMNDKVDEVFSYLTEDHNKVSEMIRELEDMTEEDRKTREDIFSELDSSLSLHADLEEATLYPVLEKKEEAEPMIQEAIEEHEGARAVLEDLRAMEKTNPDWLMKLSELKANVDHHVDEEEGTGGLFETAQRILSEDEQEEVRLSMENFLTAK